MKGSGGTGRGEWSSIVFGQDKHTERQKRKRVWVRQTRRFAKYSLWVTDKNKALLCASEKTRYALWRGYSNTLFTEQN